MWNCGVMGSNMHLFQLLHPYAVKVDKSEFFLLVKKDNFQYIDCFICGIKNDNIRECLFK